MTMTHNLNSSRYTLRGGSAELSREQLMTETPSAYAKQAYTGTSERYSFFPRYGD